MFSWFLFSDITVGAAASPVTFDGGTGFHILSGFGTRTTKQLLEPQSTVGNSGWHSLFGDIAEDYRIPNGRHATTWPTRSTAGDFR